MIFGWAMGGGPILFPPNTGVLTGLGTRGTVSGAANIVLEVHLNNVGQVSGRRIQSGIKLHMASTLRTFDLGTIVLVGSMNEVSENGRLTFPVCVTK